MIARIWHGWAPPATADAYQRHYESEVTGHLQGVGAFRAPPLPPHPARDAAPGSPSGGAPPAIPPPNPRHKSIHHGAAARAAELGNRVLQQHERGNHVVPLPMLVLAPDRNEAQDIRLAEL